MYNNTKIPTINTFLQHNLYNHFTITHPHPCTHIFIIIPKQVMPINTYIHVLLLLPTRHLLNNIRPIWTSFTICFSPYFTHQRFTCLTALRAHIHIHTHTNLQDKTYHKITQGQAFVHVFTYVRPVFNYLGFSTYFNDIYTCLHDQV